jgi:hypothetical protein
MVVLSIVKMHLSNNCHCSPSAGITWHLPANEAQADGLPSEGRDGVDSGGALFRRGEVNW